MKIARSILFQFFLLLALLLIFRCLPVDEHSMETTLGDEARLLFRSSFPEIIMALGVFWTLGGLAMVMSGWGDCAIGVVAGLAFFLFGFALEDSGICHGLMYVGGLLLVVCFLLSGLIEMFPEMSKTAGILALMGLALLGIGFVGRNSDRPIKPRYADESVDDMCDRIGDHPEAKWRIAIPYPESVLGEKVWRFEGGTADAYETARELADQYGADPDDVDLSLCSIPPAHARKMGELDWIDSRKWDDL